VAAHDTNLINDPDRWIDRLHRRQGFPNPKSVLTETHAEGTSA
jgi:hypothetical protein